MTQEAFEKAKELIAARDSYQRLVDAVSDAQKCWGTKIFVQYEQHEKRQDLCFPRDMRDRVLVMAKDYYLGQIDKLNAELEAL